MTTLQTITVLLSVGLLSCNGRNKNFTGKDSAKAGTALPDTSEKPGLISDLDTTRKFETDDFPVTDGMLADKTNKHPSYEKQSGQTLSFDKVWFGNDSLQQTVVFELYTDYYRAVTYCFYNNAIPADLIRNVELHVKGGELASDKQKLQDFRGFLQQSTKIGSPYFTTIKGYKLGDAKQKALDRYGKPDTQVTIDKNEKLEWTFEGDIPDNSKAGPKGKPLAADSFGHHVVMYFRNDKLMALIFYNDIP